MMRKQLTIRLKMENYLFLCELVNRQEQGGRESTLSHELNDLLDQLRPLTKRCGVIINLKEL
jgi:hypothetical protein